MIATAVLLAFAVLITLIVVRWRRRGWIDIDLTTEHPYDHIGHTIIDEAASNIREY